MISDVSEARFPSPLALHIVPRAALAVGIHNAEARLGAGIAFLGKQPEFPFRCRIIAAMVCCLTFVEPGAGGKKNCGECENDQAGGAQPPYSGAMPTIP